MTVIDRIQTAKTGRTWVEDAQLQRDLQAVAVFDAMKDLLFVFDDEARLLHTNPAASTSLGYSPEELVEMTVFDLHPPELRGQVSSKLADISAERTDTCELPMRRKDGTWMIVESKISRGRWSNRDVMFGVSRIIPQHKQAGEQLRQSHALLRVLSESTRDGIYVKDRQGRYLLANACLLEWYGKSETEVLGHDDRTTLLPDDARAVMELDNHVMETGVTQHFEETVRMNSQLRTCLSTKGAVRDPQGNVVGLFGISRDISARKRMEESLRKNEERLSLVSWATNDAIWDWNLTTGEVWSNDAYATLFGPWPQSIPLSRQWWCDHIHPEDRERVLKGLQTTLDGRNSVHLSQYRLQRLDGTWAPVIERAYVVRDADGKAQRILGAIQDVSDQKAVEEHLQFVQLQLAHLGRLSTIGELVASIAHEINQPLYSIVNYAKACGNLLAQPEPSLDELSEWTREIASASVRAGAIIKRLRDFCRRETKCSSSYLNEVVEESLALVAAETRRVEVAIQRELAEEDPVVDVDRIQIQQVLVNLLQNACDAMQENTTESRVLTVRTVLVEDMVEVAISDNGSGLEEASVRRLFEPFVTTKPGGLGMGLPISRTIVEKHGGRIWAAANPAGGATFHFTLPVATRGLSPAGDEVREEASHVS
jgi:two-component system, LuxR family, sensor kinase FixL